MSRTADIPTTFTPPRRRRSPLAISLAIATLAAGAWLSPRIYQHGRPYLWQRTCLNYVAAKSSPIVTFPPPTPRRVPAEWASLYRRLTDSPLTSDGTVYLHQRSANGESRLIAVDTVFSTPPSGATRVMLVPRVVRLGTPIRPAALIETLDREEWPTLPAARELKIFAGESDPADPSAFSIRYESQDEAGVFEGKLVNGESVELHRRSTP